MRVSVLSLCSRRTSTLSELLGQTKNWSDILSQLWLQKTWIFIWKQAIIEFFSRNVIFRLQVWIHLVNRKQVFYRKSNENFFLGPTFFLPLKLRTKKHLMRLNQKRYPQHGSTLSTEKSWYQIMLRTEIY